MHSSSGTKASRGQSRAHGGQETSRTHGSRAHGGHGTVFEKVEPSVTAGNVGKPAEIHEPWRSEEDRKRDEMVALRRAQQKVSRL